jgi:acetyl esterase/lipase
MMTARRPPFDPDLHALLTALPAMPVLSEQTLEMIRPYAVAPVETALAGHVLDRQEVSIAGHDGAQIPLTVLRPPDLDVSAAEAPCIYWVHGGGMVLGDRYSQIDIPLEWLARFGAVVVSVDYRLAPDASGMTPVEDCYAGLVWIAEHAGELGIDPGKLIIAGTSAGGGLAAGAALLARDRHGPVLAAQILVCPMLDHRNGTVSSRQYVGQQVWSQEANAFGWRSLLQGTDGAPVPSYVSPSLAADLAGLPTTYIDAGSAEVFRDEDVDYATRIWADGGQAELHIWAGGFHGFDALFPESGLSQAARRTRTDWLGRVLGHASSARSVRPGQTVLRPPVAS